MFGYIRPAMGALDDKQKEIFQGYYCGLCKSISKRYNHVARLTLTYDCAFLAMLLDSLEKNENEMQNSRCVTKRPVVYNDIMDYCADVNVLLAYYNVCDNERDEHTIKARGAKALLKSSYNKAQQGHKFLDTHIDEYMEKLWNKEQDKCSDPDAMGDLFGQLLSGIADMMTENQDVVKLCYNLGKYVYLLDAVDDYKKDIKDGTYNVYALKYGECDDLIERTQFNLECSLSMMDEHYRNLKLLKNKEILDNIIYIGLIQFFIKREEIA